MGDTLILVGGGGGENINIQTTEKQLCKMQGFA